MGHSKIYNSDSEYVIANIMDDVENVNTREYLIDFYAKSIYPAIEAMVLKEQKLDMICKDQKQWLKKKLLKLLLSKFQKILNCYFKKSYPKKNKFLY